MPDAVGANLIVAIAVVIIKVVIGVGIIAAIEADESATVVRMMIVMTAMIPVAPAAATSAKAVKAMAAPAHATAVLSDKLSRRFGCQLPGCETTGGGTRSPRETEKACNETTKQRTIEARHYLFSQKAV